MNAICERKVPFRAAAMQNIAAERGSMTRGGGESIINCDRKLVIMMGRQYEAKIAMY